MRVWREEAWCSLLSGGKRPGSFIAVPVNYNANEITGSMSKVQAKSLTSQLVLVLRGLHPYCN